MSNTDTTQTSAGTLHDLRLELMDMIIAHHTNISNTVTPRTKPIHTVKWSTGSAARTLLNGWARDDMGGAVYNMVKQNIVDYAQKKPFQLMGLSVVLGFTMVCAKPWRRLPFGLSATFGSVIAAKGYTWLMSLISKKF